MWALEECDEIPVMDECRSCGEIYNADDEEVCPYCGEPNPRKEQ